MPSEALTVLSVEPGADRYRVTFKRLAAYYWFPLNRDDLRDALEDARQSGTRIIVSWDAATLEILAASP